MDDEEYEYEEDEDEDEGLDEFFEILEAEDLDIDELELDPADLVNATTEDLNYIINSLETIKEAEEAENDAIVIEIEDEDEEPDYEGETD